MPYAPSEWLEGLILAESAGNPKARRYEPHQDTGVRKVRELDPDSPDIDDGLLEDDASYGLMQVMGYNVRQLCGVAKGTPMNFGFLYLPITNLSFGLRILTAELQATRGDVSRALARYNGGPTGETLQPNGKMRLEAYVRRVYEHTREVSDDMDL